MPCIFQNKPCVFFPTALTLEIFSFSDLHIIYKAQKFGMHFRQNKTCFLLLYFWVFQKRFVTLLCVSPLEVQPGGGF